MSEKALRFKVIKDLNVFYIFHILRGHLTAEQYT